MRLPQHIVIIGPAYPLRGGLASFNERLARALQSEGCSVTMYTFSLQYPSFLFPGKSQFSNAPAPANVDIQVNINSINPFNWIKIGMQLKKIKPDLIVVRFWIPFMGPALGTILRIAQRNRHTKSICIADNIVPHERRPGDRMLTAFFVRAVDAFITMSDIVLRDLRFFDAEKPAITTPHPLFDHFGDPVSKENARHYLHLPHDQNIILFFGFIRHYKGLDLLIRAMSDIRIRSKNIVLLVAGEFYQDDKVYLSLIKELKLEDRVILHTHFIPDNEVRYYCCAADVIVQPYRNATQSGVTPLAYHFDKPMIVTNVGGLAQMVADGVTGLVAESDVVSIAEHILQYFELGEEHFTPHMSTQKNKYSWKGFTSSLINVYGDLLN